MIDSRIERLTLEQRQQLVELLDAEQAAESATPEKQLIAWITGGSGLSEADLRAHATDRLTAAAVPRRFVFVEEIPRNANGKVDRRQLLSQADPVAVASENHAVTASPSEASLRRIWEHILGTNSFGDSDSYFEIGGDSLGAIRMIAMAQEVGLSLSLAMLKESPTLQALAAAVDQVPVAASAATPSRIPTSPATPSTTKRRDVSPQFRRAVEEGDLEYPLQLTAHDDLPPMILIPPQGHLVSHLWGIVVHLKKFSVWAPISRPDYDAATRSIENLAAEYLPQIRRVQPHGPYRLAGYCEGAYAAWELARMLQAEDEEVRFVGLIDTPNPDGLKIAPETFRERTKRRLNHFKGQNPATMLTHFMRRSTSWIYHRLRRRVTGERHLTRGGKRIAWLFSPKEWDGPATLLRVRKTVEGERDHYTTDVAYGWSEIAKQGLDIAFVPGDRMNFTAAPHVEVLAERLETAALHRDRVAESADDQSNRSS